MTLHRIPPAAALVTALGAASGGSIEGGAIIAIAGGAAAIVLVATALVVARRRSGDSQAVIGAETAIEANDQRVTAALKRRTLNRGRLRYDDELMTGSRETPSPDATPRTTRRSG